MEGIDVTITGGAPSGRTIAVKTKSFGRSRPGEVGPEKVGPPAFFFDVYVEGVTEGTATISITHESVGKDHKMHHWDGTQWVDHPKKGVDGKTVHAEFNVSDLNKTPIVIGT